MGTFMGEEMYRQVAERCERENCRQCRFGKGHLYWYKFTTVNGATTRSYVGRKLPTGLDMSVVESVNEQGYPLHTSEAERESSAPKDAAYRLHSLGQVRLERRIGEQWVFVTDSAWYNADVRTLFASLLSSSTSGVRQQERLRSLGRSALLEAMWPDEPEEKSSEKLNRTVHHLRNVLEPTREKKPTIFLENQGHALVLANQRLIWCDAIAFESMYHTALEEGNSLRRESTIQEALELYAGPYFLGVLETVWIANRRAELHRKAITLFLELADIWIRREYVNGALPLLKRAIKLEPTNDALAERLMRLLAQLGHYKEALHIYKTLAEALKREEEPLPTHLRLLYSDIRQRL